MMKRILCYGDSNTWGYVPVTGDRYSPEVRWPMQLQKNLGNEYWIIEEGLSGRTTVLHDPIEPYRCGIDYLLPCLMTHKPLDVVIIMLGTNDTKQRFSLSAAEIATGMEQLIRTVQASECGPNNAAPKTIILAPPLIAKEVEDPSFFGAAEKSRHIAIEYKAVAKAYQCGFLDTGSHITAGGADGVHLTAEQHGQLAEIVTEAIKSNKEFS